MVYIYSTILIRILTLGSKTVTAITLFPFIILNKNLKKTDGAVFTINHEKIHIIQQIELLIIVFFIWYCLSYLTGRIRGLSHYNAYRNIIFEKEAYDNMYNLKYIHNRKIFSFLNHT